MLHAQPMNPRDEPRETCRPRKIHQLFGALFRSADHDATANQLRQIQLLLFGADDIREQPPLAETALAGLEVETRLA